LVFRRRFSRRIQFFAPVYCGPIPRWVIRMP
jgi:hypothetical protein